MSILTSLVKSGKRKNAKTEEPSKREQERVKAQQGRTESAGSRASRGYLGRPDPGVSRGYLGRPDPGS